MSDPKRSLKWKLEDVKTDIDNIIEYIDEGRSKDYIDHAIISMIHRTELAKKDFMEWKKEPNNDLHPHEDNSRTAVYHRDDNPGGR